MVVLYFGQVKEGKRWQLVVQICSVLVVIKVLKVIIKRDRERGSFSRNGSSLAREAELAKRLRKRRRRRRSVVNSFLLE